MIGSLREATAAIGAPGGHRIWVPILANLDLAGLIRVDGSPTDGDDGALVAQIAALTAFTERCDWAGVGLSTDLTARAAAAAAYLAVRRGPGPATPDWRVWRYAQAGVAVFRRTADHNSVRVVIAGGWAGIELAIHESIALSPADSTGGGALTVARVDVSTGKGARSGLGRVGELQLRLRLDRITVDQPGGLRLRVGAGWRASADGGAVDVRSGDRRVRIGPARLDGDVVIADERCVIEVGSG